ncbi:MAG TPA: SH3 domain-containing protein [Thiobacillaceae bacterium]|nr:SH3 domain-containing protein [Thiobacillaceae bacterium]
MNIIRTGLVGGVLLLFLASAPAWAFLGISLGSDDKKDAAEVSGGAGPDGAQGESAKLEKCDKPYGTLAVSEPQDYVGQALMSYGLPSPSGLIRMIIQQSNCFVLVERGRAMKNLMQERELASSGMLRGGSNMGGGQMVTADYVLTPDVVFSQNDAGGVGSAIGGLFGWGGALIAGSLKFKKAQTSMLLADARSGLQVAAASGAAKATDFGIGGIVGGGGAVGALGAYENTAEGKVVASSFLDNWNNIVRSIRNSPEMARQQINLKAEVGKVAKAGVGLEAGDVITGKIGGLKLYASPDKKSKVLANLGKGEEVIYKGDEQNGFLLVQGNDGEGWVEKLLIRKP